MELTNSGVSRVIPELLHSYQYLQQPQSGFRNDTSKASQVKRIFTVLSVDS